MNEQNTHTTTDKGNGRVETRPLMATRALAQYLSAWPGLAQMFQVRRFPDGRTEQETADGITSLKPPTSGAAALALNHDYWSIENHLHGRGTPCSGRSPAGSGRPTARGCWPPPGTH